MENRRTFLKKCTLTTAALVALPGLPSCVRISTIKAKVPMKSTEIKTAIVLWYSQTGNTQKCGKVLAKTFKRKGIRTAYADLRDFDRAKIADADLIVIGTPVFYYDTPEYVKDYIQSLPDLTGIPVAAYVTFGGPEGNQHNAACSILEGLAQKKGVPVGLNAFMTSKSYPPSFEKYAKDLKSNTVKFLPDTQTYQNVREYAELILSRVEKETTPVFKKTMTLREFSTYLGPEYWTKQSVDNHYINKENCVQCGACVDKCPSDSIDLDTSSVNRDTCVMCFGCINTCQYQAMTMESDDKKLMAFTEFLKKNHLKYELPVELRT